MVHWFLNLIGFGDSSVPNPAQEPATAQQPVPSGPDAEAPVIPSEPDVANYYAAAIPRVLPEANDDSNDEAKDEVDVDLFPDVDISSDERNKPVSPKSRKAKNVPKRKTLVPVKYPIKANGVPRKRSVTSEQLQKLIAVEIQNVLCSEYGSYQGLTRKEISEAVKYTSNGNSGKANRNTMFHRASCI
jgi:hypothetical protein